MGKREVFRAVQSITRGVARAGLDIVLPPKTRSSKVIRTGKTFSIWMSPAAPFVAFRMNMPWERARCALDVWQSGRASPLPARLLSITMRREI